MHVQSTKSNFFMDLCVNWLKKLIVYLVLYSNPE